MKAVLVIDVDDINRYHAHVYREDEKGNGECVMNYVAFKPLPKIKYINLDDTHDDLIFEMGWNGCLDAITGDTE